MSPHSRFIREFPTSHFVWSPRSQSHICRAFKELSIGIKNINIPLILSWLNVIKWNPSERNTKLETTKRWRNVWKQKQNNWNRFIRRVGSRLTPRQRSHPSIRHRMRGIPHLQSVPLLPPFHSEGAVNHLTRCNYFHLFTRLRRTNSRPSDVIHLTRISTEKII